MNSLTLDRCNQQKVLENPGQRLVNRLSILREEMDQVLNLEVRRNYYAADLNCHHLLKQIVFFLETILLIDELDHGYYKAVI